MSKQEKRARTLLEYMGFKDPDIKSNDHDDWCLRLLNDEVIKTFFHNKMISDVYETDDLLVKISKGDNKIQYYLQKDEEKDWIDDLSVFECGCIMDWAYYKNEINYDDCKVCKNHKYFEFRNEYGVDHSDLRKKYESDIRSHFKIIDKSINICKKYKTPRISKYITKDGVLEENIKIENNIKSKAFYYYYVKDIDKQLEKVLSSPRNNFRFGFLDVYAWIEYKRYKNLIVDGKILTNLYHAIPRENMIFFEVKINTPTLGEITREVEYYKDVISTIYNFKNIHPIVIAPRKYNLPEQFDSVTFDEFNSLFPRKDQLDYKI